VSVKVVTTGTTTTLHSPYDPTLPSKARAIGGRWNGAAKAWQFDARDEPRVRELAIEVYGSDGSDGSDTGQPTVTVRVPVTGVDDEFRVAGRRLAHRPGRDDAVRLAPGVVIVTGGFSPSGGSVKNPRLEEDEGTVLEVRDVPALQAQRMVAEAGGGEILGDAAHAALIAEREQLLARLAEINAILEA
jgi:hypothetical protein